MSGPITRGKWTRLVGALGLAQTVAQTAARTQTLALALALTTALTMALTMALAACGDDGGDNQNQNGNDAGTALCGNEIPEGVEECDDGPANSDTVPDACRTDCRAAGCGDGVVDTGEECDDGPANSDAVPGACRSDCTPPRCGDRVVDVSEGEYCDCGDDPAALPDGCVAVNGDPAGACRGDCLVAFCGNGLGDPGEVCDDGNLVPGDGCSPGCNSDETCGNGVVDLLGVDGPETCDDGNRTRGDGCGDTCQIEVCGNGVLDPGEVCEDGNLLPGDGCSPDCRSDETCGNGYIDFLAGEQCDDHNFRSHDGCSSGCTGELPTWSFWQDVRGALWKAGSAYDGARQRIVLFGGEGDAGPMSSRTLEFDGGRWHLIDTPTKPRERRLTAMAYDSHRGRVLMFSGEAALSLTDTWEYDGSDWTLLTPTGSPPARAGAGLVYDSARRVFVLFGGVTTANQAMNDTWEYDPTTSTWTERNLAGIAPLPRSVFGMVYDGHRGVSVVVGGNGSSGPAQDHWEWDGSAWTERFSGVAPVVRVFPMMAYDVHRQVTVLFGGAGSCAGGGYCQDTWEFDGTAWSEVGSVASPPWARVGGALVYDERAHQTVLVGGADDTRMPLDDQWTFDGSDWADVTGTLVPSPRERAAAVHLRATGELMMFGGSTQYQGTLAEPSTWTFDGVAWRMTPCTEPGMDCPVARTGHVMVWDSLRETAVLFGGRGRDENDHWILLDDTWEHDGTGWTQVSISPAGRPPGRSEFGMSYDPVAGRVVIFGGCTSDSPLTPLLGDTWELDGTSWVETTPTVSPGALGYVGMTFDGSSMATLLVSGVDDAIIPLEETWQYAGGTWTQLTVAHQPPGRIMGLLVFDPQRNRTLLFGGQTLVGYLNDIWEWNGLDWTAVYSNNPSPRAYTAFTWDDSHKRIAMVGGQSTSLLDEVFFLRYGSAWPDEVCDNGVDDDGDLQVDCVDPDCEGQRCGSGQICEQSVCVTP